MREQDPVDAVEHQAELLALVTAVHNRDKPAIVDARDNLMSIGRIGHAGAVEVASVIGNFHMMTRVADGVGLEFPREFWKQIRSEIVWSRRFAKIRKHAVWVLGLFGLLYLLYQQFLLA